MSSDDNYQGLRRHIGLAVIFNPQKMVKCTRRIPKSNGRGTCEVERYNFPGKGIYYLTGRNHLNYYPISEGLDIQPRVYENLKPFLMSDKPIIFAYKLTSQGFDKDYGSIRLISFSEFQKIEGYFKNEDSEKLSTLLDQGKSFKGILELIPELMSSNGIASNSNAIASAPTTTDTTTTTTTDTTSNTLPSPKQKTNASTKQESSGYPDSTTDEYEVIDIL